MVKPDKNSSNQQIIRLLEDLNKKFGTIESRLSTLERSTLLESKSHISFVQDPDLPFNLQSSTVTTDFLKPSADQNLSASETQHVKTNVKDQLADSLTLTSSDPHADSPIRPSSPPYSNVFICPSSNLLDLSLAELYINNVLLARSSLHDKTIFPPLYRPQYSHSTLNFSTINYLFFFISTLATSNPCTWVTPQLRPPDPTVTKRGLLIFGN
jgi:hypothetical protein